MVKPQDDVAVVVIFWSGHGHRLIGVVSEDSERARSIKGQTTNRKGINVVLVEDTVDRGADTSPDIIGRLFLWTR